MDKLIKKAEDISLDAHDLEKIASPHKIKIILYQELHNIKDTDELFSEVDNIIVLYRTTMDYGHWISLLNYDDHIEYFDSYGKKPDYSLDISNGSLRHMNGRVIPHIQALLEQASLLNKKKIIYNKIQMQSKHHHVNTCGRWSALRIKLRHLSLHEFQNKFLNQSMKPDMVVTYLTYLLVDKDLPSIV